MPRINVPTGGSTTLWKEGGFERAKKLDSQCFWIMFGVFAFPIFPMTLFFREGLIQQMGGLLCLASIIPMLFIGRIHNHYMQKIEDCKEATHIHQITVNTSMRGYWKW